MVPIAPAKSVGVQVVSLTRLSLSIHAGMVCVADGTDLAAERLDRVLTCDPATGIFRHVDAGYEEAARIAKERRVRLTT